MADIQKPIPQNPPSRPDASGIRIRSAFVVDNDPAVCTFMSMLLEKEGYEVATAEDGLQALSELENRHPDVIFIDLVMPFISGEKLCQILRSQKRFDQTYCIVLSAISSEEEIDFVSYGFDACIAKGPLKKLGPIILDVIGKLGSEITRTKPGEVYGLEHLYRREITRELLSTKRHFELILNNMAESILETSADGRIVFANPSAVELLGVKEEILLSVDFSSLFERSQRESVKTMFDVTSSGESAEPALIDYGDRKLWMHVLHVSDDGQASLVILIDDVTERKEAEEILRRSHEDLERRVRERTAELAEANETLTREIENRRRLEEELRASLREKEVLLDEIHHRVKNNLQIISSMLGLKASRVENEELRTVVADMRNRIHSISLVHDTLYGSKNLAEVYIGDYIGALVSNLVGSYADTKCEVTSNVEADEIQLPLNIAVPCALVVNELVTNALKYAFVGRSTGTLSVRIRQVDEKHFRLEVSDDGVGIPDLKSLEKGNTLGYRIIKVLAGQVGGPIRIGNKNGTTIMFEIPIPDDEITKVKYIRLDESGESEDIHE